MRRARAAAALLALAGIAAGAAAQDGRPDRGRVTDRSTGLPVDGARITWYPDSSPDAARTVRAGPDGAYHLPADWRGGRLMVRAIGYRAVTLSWQDDLGQVGLEPLPELLAQVIITASGRRQSRADVALPVLRVDAEAIASSGASSAGALLQEVPGLQPVTASSPIGSTIAIRGIGGSRVLLLVDGQPAGGSLIENRDLSRMSLAGVEHVEVVKGPLSSLYGSDALGGVINLITDDPPPGFRVSGRALFGDAGRREAETTVSGGNALRYRVTGGWREQDGVPGAGLDAFARTWDFRSTVRYPSWAFAQIRGDLNAVRERQRWPVGGGFTGFNDNTGITGWTELTRPGAGGQLSLRILHQSYEHLFRSARGDAPIAGDDRDQQRERLWTVATRWSGVRGAHEVDLGLELADRGITSPGKLLDDQAGDRQVEVHGQDAWHLGGLTLTGGARLTANDRWGTAVSPTLGVSVPWTDAVRVRTSLGRGFRAPSFKELAWNFANVGAGYVVQGNENLSPERSWNLSGGMSWTPDERVTIDLEAYANRLTDLIEFAFLGNTPAGLLVYSPANVQRARTRGVEASVGVRGNRWSLQGDYAFLDARALDDDVGLDRRAPHTARVRVDMDLTRDESVTLSLDARHTSDAPLVGTGDDGRMARIGTQDALTALDLGVGLRLLSGSRVLVGVDNVFDARPAGWQSVIARRIRLELRLDGGR